MSFSSSKILSASGNFISNTFTRSSGLSSSFFFNPADIKYGNNIFVAIPSDNTAVNSQNCRAIKSTNGVTWAVAGGLPIIGTSSNEQRWKLLIYGNNTYVAFNESVQMSGLDGGGISTDSGDSWSSISAPTLYDTVWGGYLNNFFYRLGGGGTPTLQYSSNGSNWSSILLPTGNFSYPYSMAFGGGMYSIVCLVGNTCAYSSDGLNWSQASFPIFSENVVYGNGVFVSSSRDQNKIAYSSNGQNWSTVTLPEIASNKIVRISFLNNKFIAVGAGTDSAFYSDDGINWSATKLPIIQFWSKPLYSNGLYFTYTSSNIFAYSLDGINWRPLIINGDITQGFVGVVSANSSNEIVFIGENNLSVNYLYRLTLP